MYQFLLVLFQKLHIPLDLLIKIKYSNFYEKSRNMSYQWWCSELFTTFIESMCELQTFVWNKQKITYTHV